MDSKKHTLPVHDGQIELILTVEEWINDRLVMRMGDNEFATTCMPDVYVADGDYTYTKFTGPADQLKKLQEYINSNHFEFTDVLGIHDHAETPPGWRLACTLQKEKVVGLSYGLDGEMRTYEYAAVE